MDETITSGDEGKHVVDADGNDVGIIESVRGGTAQVNPDPGITDSILSKLGWNEPGEDTYPLESDRIESITDDEVRLGR